MQWMCMQYMCNVKCFKKCFLLWTCCKNMRPHYFGTYAPVRGTVIYRNIYRNIPYGKSIRFHMRSWVHDNMYIYIYIYIYIYLFIYIYIYIYIYILAKAGVAGRAVAFSSVAAGAHSKNKSPCIICIIFLLFMFATLRATPEEPRTWKPPSYFVRQHFRKTSFVRTSVSKSIKFALFW